MHRLTKKEKIMIGAAVSTVIFISLYVFVYQPKRKEALKLQEKIKTTGHEIESILKTIPRLRKLEEEVAREQQKVTLIKKTTFDEQPAQGLLQQLAREAHRLNMDVICLKLRGEPPLEKSRYERLTMMMDIQCSYRHLGSYLKALSDLSGLTSLDEIEIVRDNRVFPKLRVKLTLSSFVSRT